MKIAVAAHELEGETTGVGRYLEGLLSGLTEVGPRSEWLLFMKGEAFDHPLWNQDGPVRLTPVFDHRPRAHPVLWEQLALPRRVRRESPTLFFSPAYSLPPVGDVPSLVTLHDLSFEHLGHELGFKERWRRRLLARRAARRATRLLADTRRGEADLVKTYGVDPGRVGVVPLAVDERFRPAANDAERAADREVLEGLGLAEPYLLFMGSVLARRHLDRALAAFAAMSVAHPDLRFVVAGANRLGRPADLDAWIEATGVPERVEVLGWVSEEALVPLYRRATACVYLSSYEGFGLPPLESLACATPVVVAPGLALDDLWADYPARVGEPTVEAVTALLARLLADEPWRRELAEAGARRMAGLGWDHAAECLLEEIDITLRWRRSGAP